MKHNARSGRLTGVELAAIDLSITALQARGAKLGDAATTSNNPHEMMADALADLRHPTIDLPERDLAILAQIKELAGQLSVETSLEDLIAARAEIIRNQ